MLTEQQKIILNYIRSLSRDGSFKVIDAEELLSLVPDMSKADLAVMLKDLAEREYILVKFANLESYCIASSNKAIIEEEKAAIVTQKIIEESSGGVTLGGNKQLKHTFFLVAFGGAFVGGLVSGVIQLIIALLA